MSEQAPAWPDQHDPICPRSGLVVMEWDRCTCSSIRAARADERARVEALLTLQESERIGDLMRTYEQEVRERIASAVEAVEREARDMVTHPDSYATGPLWLSRADAMSDAARLARNGGGDE